MAMVKCIDCEAMISDRASACPRCGGPIVPAAPPPTSGIPTSAPVAAPQPASTEPSQRPKWQHALGIICVAIAAGTAYDYATNGAAPLVLLLATGVGVGLIPMLIPLLVLAFRNPSAAWKSLAIAMAILGYLAWGQLQDKARDWKVVREEAARLQTQAEQLRAGEIPSAKPPPVSARLPASDGEHMRAIRETFIGLNAELTLKLKAIADQEAKHPVAEVLGAENLATPAGIARGRAAVAEWGRLQEQREQVFRDHGEELDKHASGLFTGDNLATYQKGRAGREELVANISKSQRASIAAVASILDYVEGHAGEIEFQDGQLMFQTDETLAEFNARQQRLMAASAELRFQLSKYEEQRQKAFSLISTSWQ